MKRFFLGVLAFLMVFMGAFARDVMLIGDSIRLGYGPDVKRILEAQGDRVFQPEDNCRYALYTLRNLSGWVSRIQDPSAIEVVHWNNGLWDIGELLPGECTTPVDVYVGFLERIVDITSRMRKSFLRQRRPLTERFRMPIIHSATARSLSTMLRRVVHLPGKL